MEGLCENCKYIDKRHKYHSIFDDDIWYGCKKLVQGSTKDRYNKFGELIYNDTNPRCYQDNPQLKIEDME